MFARTEAQQVPTRLGPVECAVWGDGPTVLALHGAMGGYDQGVLLAQAAAGTMDFGFVAPSRPGYLGSAIQLGRTPEEQADQCAALLDSLGRESAAVVAISGGGQCALQFALRHASRCRGLVMISACSAPLTARIPFRFQLMKLFAHVPGLPERMQRKVLEDPVAAAKRSIPDPLLRERTFRHAEAGRMLTTLQLLTLDRMGERMKGTSNDIYQSRRAFSYPLETIRTPLLVIHGTEDEAVPAADAQALSSRVPGAEMLLIEGGRHTVLFTHLDQIRGRVLPFFHRGFGRQATT